MDIYIGNALTEAPEQFLEEVAIVKQEVRRLGHNVLEYLGTTIGTPEDVVLKDLGNVEECELFVAICDHVAFGVGAETLHALHCGKQVLAFAQQDRRISRFPLGLAAKFPSLYTFKRYDSLLHDVPIMIKSKVLKMHMR